MTVEVSQRLGCLAGGADDVMQHAWFASIDWDRMQARDYRMPFEPMLMGATDTSYFLVENQVFGRDFDKRFENDAKREDFATLFADF